MSRMWEDMRKQAEAAFSKRLTFNLYMIKGAQII
jgi:hypothetical protein